MLKPVKQVGSNGNSSSNGFSSNGSTHEIEGALETVTPTPKSNVKRLNPIKLKQLEERVTELEAELPDLEARILAAEQQQAIFTTAEAAQAIAAELDTLRAQHAAHTAEWEELATQLEEQAVA
jgi:ATP-binding cassette subfamily F protein 3